MINFSEKWDKKQQKTVIIPVSKLYILMGSAVTAVALSAYVMFFAPLGC